MACMDVKPICSVWDTRLKISVFPFQIKHPRTGSDLIMTHQVEFDMIIC